MTTQPTNLAIAVLLRYFLGRFIERSTDAGHLGLHFTTVSKKEYCSGDGKTGRLFQRNFGQPIVQFSPPSHRRSSVWGSGVEYSDNHYNLSQRPILIQSIDVPGAQVSLTNPCVA